MNKMINTFDSTLIVNKWDQSKTTTLDPLKAMISRFLEKSSGDIKEANKTTSPLYNSTRKITHAQYQLGHLENNFKRIYSFENIVLGGKCRSVTKDTIESAKDVLLYLDLEYQPFITPTYHGGIQFEFHSKQGHYLEFEILNNKFEYYLQKGEHEEEGSTDSIEKINELVCELYR